MFYPFALTPIAFYPFTFAPLASPGRGWQGGRERGLRCVQSHASELYSGRDTALGVKMSFPGALGWSC